MKSIAMGTNNIIYKACGADEPGRAGAVKHAGVEHRENEVNGQDDEQDLLPARHFLCGIAHDAGLGAFVRIDDHDEGFLSRGIAGSV